MTKKKYEELRKNRFEEREERFKREKERIEKQKKALEQRKRSEAERRRTQAKLLEKEEIAREAITNVRTAAEEAEDKTKISLYVPEMMQKINEMLTDADKNFDSADYEKAIKLSYEIEELLEKARLEASRKAEEERREGRRRRSISTA